MNKLINTPNILTVSRIILIPVIVFCFFMQSTSGNAIVLAIFVFCCITDFLDGYFARAYKQTTKLGQILDPIADKVLISTTILFLAGFQKISSLTLIPACLILCREVMISEIRDIVFAQKKQFTTSVAAKWKTAVQMFSIATILTAQLLPNNGNILIIGEALFWFSSIISLFSGISYYIRHWSSITS